MGEDRLERLRRLGIVKSARDLKPASPQREISNKVSEPGSKPDMTAGDMGNQPLEILLPGGRTVETEYGSCFVLDHVYPITHQHGDEQLAGLQGLPTAVAATICQDNRLADFRFEDFLFLDTETTGLYGAGTIAFMVGAAFYESDQAGRQVFVVQQYFLRDHGDESAMLHLLSELLAKRPALVTFNGRSFDLPLLETRYLMNRLDGVIGDLLERPHVDLLPPARRLWKRRIGSCSLNSLEQNLLGLQRNREDVPGWAIPGLYMDYLRTGDARDLLRVFYHNRIDLLSMVTLTRRIVDQFSRPQPIDHPLDLVSLARWQLALGLKTEAEQSLRLMVEQDLPLDHFHSALHELAMLLKRDGRRDEAVLFWKQIAVSSLDDVTAHVELAKHYEWHDQDLVVAHHWTEQALALAETGQTFNATIQREELQHRLDRLKRKIANRYEE